MKPTTISKYYKHDDLDSLHRQHKWGINAIRSIDIIGDKIASGGRLACEVWSITNGRKLYTANHEHLVNHVKLMPDLTLGFDLITASADKTVKLWRKGFQFKTLGHNHSCWHFDLSQDHCLLAVATGMDKNGGVSFWRVDNFSKAAEENIGHTKAVRLNVDSTTIIAVKASGDVFEIVSEDTL